MIMKGDKLMQVVAMVIVIMMMASGAWAASCNAGSLVSCASAISSGGKPTAACCSKLRSQQGCFCQFAKNPTYGRYVSSPNARKTVAACGLAVPRC